MSQAINLRALRWAYDQNDLGVTAKAILVTFAIHADQRGYTWPSVDRIAFTWQLDRRTVRRQIEALLVRRRICRTKKRCGFTGQVKVYRLPKIAWESGGGMHRFENTESWHEAKTKRGQSSGEMHPEHNNNKQTSKSPPTPTGGNATPTASTKATHQSDVCVEGYQHQNQPPQNHPKWSEFAGWCHRQGGAPTSQGFWTWLAKQKPQWRNKVRKDFTESGYVLDGQFLTADEANRRGMADPELLTKFRKAVRRKGAIKIVEKNGEGKETKKPCADEIPLDA